MKATVINAWSDDTSAYLAVAVEEDDGSTVEYIGQITLDTEISKEDDTVITFKDLSKADQQKALIEAVKEKRNKQVSGIESIKMPKTIEV